MKQFLCIKAKQRETATFYMAQFRIAAVSHVFKRLNKAPLFASALARSIRYNVILFQGEPERERCIMHYFFALLLRIIFIQNIRMGSYRSSLGDYFFFSEINLE